MFGIERATLRTKFWLFLDEMLITFGVELDCENVAREIARSRYPSARRPVKDKRTISGKGMDDDFCCHDKATFGIERVILRTKC